VFRPALLFIAAALLGPPASAQTAKLEDHKEFQAGLRALRDQLPDLAIRRFAQAKTDFQDDEEASRILNLKIGEASVRAARMESEPPAAIARAEMALKALASPSLKNNEGAIFWSAQAALLLGRFQEAADFFGRLSKAEDPAVRFRSQLTAAQLLAALHRREDATAILETLSGVADPAVATEARLLHASLLLAEGKLGLVDSLLGEGVAPENQTHANYQRYLRARLAQAKGAHDQAAALFRELSEEPEKTQLPTAIHHGAILGHAESLYAGEKIDEAVVRLVGLIDKYPRTPLLEGAFARLLGWAQANETLKLRFEERLGDWAGAPSLAEYKAKSTRAPEENPAPNPVIPKAAAERAGYALYYYALHLAERNTSESTQLAEVLLERLRTEYPDHALAPASLLETAWLQSAGDDLKGAIATLTLLEESALSPDLRAKAGKLVARLQFKDGDFKGAAEAFSRVRKSLQSDQQDIAAMNAGISLLRAGDSAGFGSLLESIEPSETRLLLQLEQALQQAARAEGDARPVLHRFLRENPNHRRVAEARLALASESLRLEPQLAPAQEMAKAQLDSVDPSTLDDSAALRRLLIRLKLAQVTGDWAPAIADANRFLDRESVTLDPIIRLKLAEAYFRNGDLNKARLEFNKIADEQKEGLLHEVALFFAAKAALKLGTEKSPEEARTLLQLVIQGKGVLADQARLLLARSLIDKPLPSEALVTLQPLLTGAVDDEVNRVDALVLAAEAHRVLGEDTNIREAIKIYDRILALEELPYSLSNRIHALKGQIYELLKEPGNALESYYRVINRENLPKGQEPTEWFWYNECGFKMVRLFEQGKRWHTALEILRRMAASGSPRAEEAADRAKKLQLEHQIWDLK